MQQFYLRLKISTQYAYVKDFMDRNIEYFSVFTGVAVGIISVLFGLIFYWNITKDIDRLRDDVTRTCSTLTSDVKSSIAELNNTTADKFISYDKRHEIHDSEFNKLKKNLLILVASTSSQGNNISGKQNDYHPAAFSYFKTLVNILLAYEGDDKSTHSFNSFFGMNLRNLELCIEKLDTAINYSDFLTREDISTLTALTPDKYKDQVLKAIVSFKEKCS